MSPLDADEAVRAFIKAWNIDADEGRRRVLEGCCQPDARFVSSQGVISGLDAFSASVGAFRRVFPNAVVVLGRPDSHNGYARFRWETRWNDGREPLFGDDFVEFGADGRIRLVVSFDGEPAGPVT